MKKLMIVAATAAITCGAYAADLGFCDEDKDLAGCLVYDVKIQLKTPVPVTIKCREKDLCDDNSWCVTYAKLGKLTLNGLLWACEYDCTDYGTLDGFAFALWDKKTKTPYVTVQNGKEQNFGSIALQRFGKKATDVEVLFGIAAAPDCAGKLCEDAADVERASIDLTLAGVGKWDTKNEYMKSASGYAAGIRTFSSAETTCSYDCAEDGPLFLDLCDEFDSWCTDGVQKDWTIAWGTWTIKVNTKAMKSGKNYASYIPSYCICK